jgi:hypothetical protein
VKKERRLNNMIFYKFYSDGQYDSTTIAQEGDFQLRGKDYNGGGGSVWHKEWDGWKQVTSHYYDLNDARDYYNYFVKEQYSMNKRKSN